MDKNDVWALVKRPTFFKKSDVIDSRWVFKAKGHKKKAWLVVRGFKDRTIYELTDETYSPITRLPLIRAVLSAANKNNWELCQIDVKTDFLHGELDKPIYMEIPEGLEVDDEIRRTKVCKLKKSSYGLRVIPKKWNERFLKEMRQQGLENSLHESCLNSYREKCEMSAVIPYVDNMLITSNKPERVQEIKTRLN